MRGFVRPALKLAGRTAVVNTIGAVRVGGIASARYCYSVWLRHLVRLHENGIAGVPESVVELGPGDSLGVGVCALLSGAKEYCALDAARGVDVGNPKPLEEQFDELVRLFERRAPIPDNTEFPRIHPELASYVFPTEILTDERLEAGLDGSRLRRIREELRTVGTGANELLRYVAPWDGSVAIRPGSVDLVLSQAVMEYVDDLETAYGLMYGWLRTGGAISHEIDFKSHGTAIAWDGHWGYSSRMWKLVNGRSAHPITRYPHSHHITKIGEAGFRVIADEVASREPELPRGRIDPDLADLFDDSDTTISSSLVQAVKPGALFNIYFRNT